MSVFKNILATTLLFAIAACGPSGDSVEGSAPALQDIGSPTDNYGVYTGTVDGEPGFMVIFQGVSAMPTINISILQRGDSIRAFMGGGLAATEPQFNFESGWPGGGGTFYDSGTESEPNRGAAMITGNWTINDRMTGTVRRFPGRQSVLDFDVQFDPITLSTAPEGNSIPAGRYDIIYDDQDIGDFEVAPPGGAGIGSVTWPGASAACEIGASTGVRAPGTTRNVWQIQFNTDLACTVPVWSVGYAVANGRRLTFELFASRGLATTGRPAPAGEQDAMHIQLKRRS